MKAFIEDLLETLIWLVGLAMWGAWGLAYGLARIWMHQAHRTPKRSP